MISTLRAVVLAILALGLLALGSIMIEVSMTEEDEVAAIRALPRPIRTAFLNTILGGRVEPCGLCHGWVGGALEYLQEEAKSDATLYPYNEKALKFINENIEPMFEEPLPGQACKAMLMKRNAALFRTFLNRFANNPVSRDSCLRHGPDLVGRSEPEVSDSVDLFLQKVAQKEI